MVVRVIPGETPCASDRCAALPAPKSRHSAIWTLFDDAAGSPGGGGVAAAGSALARDNNTAGLPGGCCTECGTGVPRVLLRRGVQGPSCASSGRSADKDAGPRGTPASSTPGVAVVAATAAWAATQAAAAAAQAAGSPRAGGGGCRGGLCRPAQLGDLARPPGLQLAPVNDCGIDACGLTCCPSSAPSVSACQPGAHWWGRDRMASRISVATNSSFVVMSTSALRIAVCSATSCSWRSCSSLRHEATCFLSCCNLVSSAWPRRQRLSAFCARTASTSFMMS
mmetsp:Transcript_69444/g.214809  ORF Transcript_69444/g.214809 Transcript_69444/m.214809 type:complete len:281 (+) Transcript_69444:506-1348(+)